MTSLWKHIIGKRNGRPPCQLLVFGWKRKLPLINSALVTWTKFSFNLQSWPLSINVAGRTEEDKSATISSPTSSTAGIWESQTIYTPYCLAGALHSFYQIYRYSTDILTPIMCTQSSFTKTGISDTAFSYLSDQFSLHYVNRETLFILGQWTYNWINMYFDFNYCSCPFARAGYMLVNI